jgi:hypothetical protein
MVYFGYPCNQLADFTPWNLANDQEVKDLEADRLAALNPVVTKVNPVVPKVKRHNAIIPIYVSLASV